MGGMKKKKKKLAARTYTVIARSTNSGLIMCRLNRPLLPSIDRNVERKRTSAHIHTHTHTQSSKTHAKRETHTYIHTRTLQQPLLHVLASELQSQQLAEAGVPHDCAGNRIREYKLLLIVEPLNQWQIMYRNMTKCANKKNKVQIYRSM